MLGTSLWGVLDISLLHQRYEIIETVEIIQKDKIFKKYGFDIRLIDGMNFVQKIPWFNGNDEFIKENSLYLFDRPNYQTYIVYMNLNRLKHIKK